MERIKRNYVASKKIKIITEIRKREENNESKHRGK